MCVCVGWGAVQISNWFGIYNLQRTLQNMSFGSSKGIKVVHVGTEEHKMAKLLKDLFVEFFNHQKRLHEKLDLDVENILQLHQAL